jgi:hypothetical protein
MKFTFRDFGAAANFQPLHTETDRWVAVHVALRQEPFKTAYGVRHHDR